MSLKTCLDLIAFIFRIMIITSGILLIDKVFYILFAFLPGKKFAKAKVNHKYAVLIPARDESNVIESLLKSIKTQNYPQELIDIFVVVEDPQDPTVEICKKYNAEVTVRKHLELKGKGHALDELLDDMYSKGYRGKYEAYFIFDADNIMTSNYMSEMNNVFDNGYQIGLGYRNSKNWNESWVAASSALIFSMLNSFHNKFNSKIGGEMILSGTGFFVDAKIIDHMDGWKFYCLTEDAELSNFSALNNFKTTYCTTAEFYDEQPSKFKVSSKQRTRWVKGYLQASKKYGGKIIKSAIKEKKGRVRKVSHLLSILPIILMVAAVVFYCIASFCLGIYGIVIKDPVGMDALKRCLIVFVMTYLVLAMFYLLMILCEFHRTDMKVWTAIKTVILGPVFMFWFLPIFVKSVFSKNVNWDKIEHHINMEITDADLAKTEENLKLDN